DGRRTSWSQTNDPAGRVREEYRDATGNLIQVVDHPDIFTSDITRYTYDAVGNLRTVSQGAQTRSFDYTSLGRLSRAFNPETGDIAYEYYDSGNLKSRRDGRPAVTEYAYDGLGRLVNKTYSGVGAGGAPAVTYAYGQSGPNAGRLTSVSTSSGTQSYTYDLLGRVISNTQTIAGAGAYTFSYDYWPNDVLKSIRYPSGKLVQYGVDSAGRVNKASAADVVYADLTEAPGPGPAPAFYSPDGRIALMKLGNGLWETHDFRAPDPGNPARLMLGATAGSGDRVQLEYQYLTPGEPWDGNLKAATIRRNGRAWQQHYFYDALDRIDCVIEAPDRPAGCDAPGMWSETFGYDRYGNRWVTSSSQQNRDAAHEPRFASDFDPATNRLTDARLAGVQYDDAGNLTGLTPRTLVYDAENRLVAVKLTATGDTLGTFVYDGEGRRIARTWLGATTYYLYNINGQVAVEYSTIAYPESSRSYVFTDMLGSVRAISSENGAVTECHDYLPFGEELSSADGAPGNTRDLPCFGAASVLSQKFTGQQRDSETGLDYFIARYMSPVQGRFTSPDTPFADQHVADPQTWNLYEYARNNPISNVDPSGQAYFVCNLKGECYRREIQSVWWIGQGEVRFANGEIFARRKATGDFTLLVGTYTWAPDGDIYPTLADPIALLAGGMVRKSGTFLAASFATRTAAADASGAALGLAADSTTSLEYVLQKVETLDFSTASNKAVFYSGPGQWARATAFAERTGKTTIEMTSGGRELAADSVFQSLSPAEQFQVWQRASTPFAKGASGEVHAFIRGARPDRTFRTIEEKLLDANANVHRYIYHY
ncbi:MAG TPA: RHS repeat-associated core domain-containing protein, partial [Terriglobia bacterium]|nr:RHS repeat-associated core domain-containing protein [Terriglobia bacterium]